MSTLAQRFLSEMDQEWSYLSTLERQRQREQLEAQLSERVQIERELGADDTEAQRRAVAALGSQWSLGVLPPIRLSPVWQVAFVWLAVRSLISQLNGAIPLPRGRVLELNIDPKWLVVSILSVILATFAARWWHPRAAVRGVLSGVALSTVLGLFNLVLVHLAKAQLERLGTHLPEASFSSLHTLLGYLIPIVVAPLTLWLAPKAKKAKASLADPSLWR